MNGIEKLPKGSLGSLVVATFICLLATLGTLSLTFCPVTNGWFGRYICLFGIDIDFVVPPTT